MDNAALVGKKKKKKKTLTAAGAAAKAGAKKRKAKPEPEEEEEPPTAAPTTTAASKVPGKKLKKKKKKQAVAEAAPAEDSAGEDAAQDDGAEEAEEAPPPKKRKAPAAAEAAEEEDDDEEEHGASTSAPLDAEIRAGVVSVKGVMSDHRFEALELSDASQNGAPCPCSPCARPPPLSSPHARLTPGARPVNECRTEGDGFHTHDGDPGADYPRAPHGARRDGPGQDGRREDAGLSHPGSRAACQGKCQIPTVAALHCTPCGDWKAERWAHIGPRLHRPCSQAKFKPRNGTGVLVISPTRELTLQSYGVLRELCK